LGWYSGMEVVLLEWRDSSVMRSVHNPNLWFIRPVHLLAWESFGEGVDKIFGSVDFETFGRYLERGDDVVVYEAPSLFDAWSDLNRGKSHGE